MHWVRCLRPNKEKHNRDFDPEFVLHQMRCVGMAQTVSMRKCGYSGRMLFPYFVEKYKVSTFKKKKKKNTHCYSVSLT